MKRLNAREVAQQPVHIGGLIDDICQKYGIPVPPTEESAKGQSSLPGFQSDESTQRLAFETGVRKVPRHNKWRRR